MSFGQRTSGPAPRPTAAPRRVRRGGYWLGLLTFVVVAGLDLVGMSMIPALNPTARALHDLAGLALVAVLNVAAVAAVVMLLADWVLRWAGWRRPWVYALVCGTATYAIAFGLVSLGGHPGLVFMAGMALIPGAAGGWVMSLFR